MDPIKEAFSKIKDEIQQLKQEIQQLKAQQTDTPTHNQTIPTHNQAQAPQQTDAPTHNQTIPTHNQSIQSPYPSNSNVSIGNRGVPTNRQTDSQTHQQTQIPTHQQTFPPISTQSDYSNSPHSDFKQANNILSELDSIKKGIRLKFKRLTPQEMLVFSHLYALEDQNIEEITYRTLATQLSLSESSIRDYINKLTKKGVPIEKIRQNNKTILLKISPDLKNVANLATIQTLREL